MVIGIGKVGVGLWANVLLKDVKSYPNINKVHILTALKEKGEASYGSTYYKMYKNLNDYKVALKAGE